MAGFKEGVGQEARAPGPPPAKPGTAVILVMVGEV